MAGLTGPISDEFFSELDALKLSLIETNANGFDPARMKTLSLETSAIRLQLKRLAADREVIAAERKRRSLDG